MREIVDGVFEVSIGYVHAHLVVVDDGVVLIDTGLPGRSAEIGRALFQMRRRIGEVTTILLTHHHPDHVGGLGEVRRRRSGARVVAHRLDVPRIDGSRTVRPRGILRLAERVMGRPEPVGVDEVLAGDGPAPVPGFTAVHTPGHTAGHTSYLLDRAGGVLFAGDAAAGGRRKLGTGPRMVTEDMDQVPRSIAKLAALEFDTAVFGHGRAFRGRAVEKFREFAA